jgi:hypothetical protein
MMAVRRPVGVPVAVRTPPCGLLVAVSRRGTLTVRAPRGILGFSGEGD